MNISLETLYAAVRCNGLEADTPVEFFDPTSFYPVLSQTIDQVKACDPDTAAKFPLVAIVAVEVRVLKALQPDGNWRTMCQGQDGRPT